LKETDTRIGEALKIDWSDLDTEKKTIAINHPEKQGILGLSKFLTN
jgi:integrase